MGWFDRFRSRREPSPQGSPAPGPTPPAPRPPAAGERPEARTTPVVSPQIIPADDGGHDDRGATILPGAANGGSVPVYNDGGAAAVAFALALQPELDPSAARAASQFAAGDVIAETYRVTQVLGETKYFWACRAEHLRWNVPIVVKSPRLDVLRQTGAARAIVSDASRWTALGLHPHIVYCHQIHTCNGVPLVIIEYVNGGNLRPWIASGRTAQLHLGLNLAIQICHGLDHAHGQGLWHGALVPENMLLTDGGVLRIADFWSELRAVAAHRATGSAAAARQRWEEALGPYIAPERWVSSGTLDARSDIFALGVCLYEIFCGARPHEIARGPRRSAPEPRGAQADARLPDRLAALLKHCVDWDPERRPQSVAEIGRQLSALHVELLGKPSPFARPSAFNGADGWNNQALVALLQGRAADASLAWERALAIDPSHLETTYNAAVSRWRRGELTDDVVARRVEETAAACSYEWRGSYLLALVHLERGDAHAALQLLEKVAPLAGGDAEVEATLIDARKRAAEAADNARVISSHRGFVSDLSMTADGKRILSVGEDNALRLTDVVSGGLMHTLEGHTGRPSCVRFNADGSRALSGGEDCSLRLWEVATAQCLKTIALAGPVFAVGISADGAVGVSACSSSEKMVDDTWLQVWDLKGGRCLGKLVGHTSTAKAIGISADGRRAVSGSDDHSVRIWDLSSFMCRLVLSGHEHHVSAVNLSDNGHYVVSGGWDRTVRLWDANTGRCLHIFTGHEGIVTSVCISPDGRLVVSGSWDNTVRLWDTRSRRCLSTFRSHSSMVTAVAMSADARIAASASWDRYIRVWPLPSADSPPGPLRLSTRVTQRTVLAVQLQPAELLDEADAAIKDGRWGEALARVRQVRHLADRKPEARALRLWRTLSGACRRTDLQGATVSVSIGTRHPLYGGCLTSDTRWVLAATRADTVEVWDVDLERCARSLSGHGDRVLAVCLSRDDRFALSASADRTLRLWDVATGKCLRVLSGHQSVVVAAALSPDQERAVSGSYDHRVKLWRLDSGECTATLVGHRRQVTAVALSNDGRWVASASLDETVRLWDVTSGEEIQVFSGHTGGALAASLSDGAWVLSGARDGSVRLWERTTGKCLQVFEGHSGPVVAVFITADERWGFSASRDRTVRVWNLRAGNCAKVLDDQSDPLTGLSVGKDGSSLLVTTAQPAFHIWELDWELEAPEEDTGSR